MKVLMFGWEFPPHISGGLGTASYGLSRALLKTGMEILFVVPKAYGDEEPGNIRLVNASQVAVNATDEAFKDHWDQISFLEVDSALMPYATEEDYIMISEQFRPGSQPEKPERNTHTYTFFGGYGKNLWEEVQRYALVASQIANQHDFDIIHAHDWLTYPAGIEAKRISGSPLVVHIHATEFDRSGAQVNQRIFDTEKNGMETADMVIAVSNRTRNTVINRYGIDPAKVVTIHNGVEAIGNGKPLRVKKHVKEKIVTFLGRVTYQKGPEYFIEAAYKVLQKDPDVRFVMAGSGDLLSKMIRRVAALGIATRFHFTGFLKNEEVEQLFGMSDVYVMPSVSEPFGISPLEAMRSNVPVIISRQSGVAEVINHAVKVDYWDIDALADAIHALIHYPSLQNTSVGFGKEEVNNIRWDDAGIKVREVYEQLVHKLLSNKTGR